MHSFPKVIKYTAESLLKVINESNDKFPKESIKNNSFFEYITLYLSFEFSKNVKSVAKTIVVEDHYVSESYLNDHKFYYSSSFDNIPKFTTRIHFFSDEKTVDDFVSSGLRANDEDRYKEIWNSYLGYITVRPLGSSLFGTCILKPYPQDSKNLRFFNSTIDNLRFDVFGKKIDWLDSLGFQQQDSVVGACATYSIWVAFHKLSKLFRVKMMSPHEITLRAGRSESNIGRIFPTVGLSIHQMIKAIESSGLAVEIFEQSDLDNHYLKALTYAYNKMGIPLLLGYDLIGYDNISKSTTHLGKHVVPVVGFRISDKLVFNNEDVDFDKLSSDISRLYTHNDQLGPFCKLDFLKDDEDLSESKNPVQKKEFLNKLKEDIGRSHDREQDALLKKVKDTGRDEEYHKKWQRVIENRYRLDNNYLKTFQLNKDFKVAEPSTLIVPIDSDIKISFKKISRLINSFNFHLGRISKYDIYENVDFKWEIYLDFALNYKQDFHNHRKVDGILAEEREKILFTTYPKYLWVARILGSDKKRYCDLVFDATALPNERCLFQMNFFSRVFADNYCQELLDSTASHVALEFTLNSRYKEKITTIYNKLQSLYDKAS